MPELLVAEQLSDYLIAQGLVAAVESAPTMALPSVWINPRDDGAPQPRAGEATTVTLVTVSTGRAPNAPWCQLDVVDVVIRATDERAGQLLGRQVADLLAPLDQLGGRKQWTMGDLLVERSDVFRPAQPIRLSQGTGRTYDTAQAFQFFCRRKALAGTPLVP